MRFKIVRIAALAALVISLFFTADSGLNLLGALVPEMNPDGIGVNSVLHSLFGIWDSVHTRADFYTCFAAAVWVSFGLFVVNAALAVIAWLHRD